MALSEILGALKTQLGGISGIKAVYNHTDLPESFEPADLPALLVLPGVGDLTASGAEAAMSVHHLRIVLVGLPASQGTLAERMTQLVDLVEKVRDAIIAHLGLGLSGVVYAAPARYSFQMYAEVYAAVEFTVDVHERTLVNVAR